ncbi:MAG: hypothetical protein QW292_08415 [Candidatus Parvarchaeota archaeon]
MGIIAVKIAADPDIHATFNGARHKEEARIAKHQRTQAMLSAMGAGVGFSSGGASLGGGELPF